MRTIFERRAAVMKTVPKFLWGSFRVALKLALEEISVGVDGHNVIRQERGWKLFLLLPRMLLHRPPRSGIISKAKFAKRFETFAGGQWAQLIMDSEQCAELAATGLRRRQRRQGQEGVGRLGELSCGRQALEGAELAPGTLATLRELTDPAKRPSRPREPVPALPEVVSLFELDQKLFSRNLRTAKKGAAGGLSGMTTEHLRPLLHSSRDTQLLFRVGEFLARAQIPESVVDIVRLGRLTALSKPGGGVRGIVAGEVIRRVVARTMAQQLGSAVEAATAPFQFALSTRAGSECVAHALQFLTETDPEATITSVDGVSAFDLVSRRAMLQGLASVGGGRCRVALRAPVLWPPLHIFVGG